jgi:hypothetical protein
LKSTKVQPWIQEVINPNPSKTVRTHSLQEMMSQTLLALACAQPSMMRFAKAAAAPWVKWVIGYFSRMKKRPPFGSAYAQKGLPHGFKDRPKKISPTSGLIF